MASPIFMLAPEPDISFGTAPSGSTYVSNQYGLIIITNGSVLDQAALISAGCVTLYPATLSPFTVSTLPAASTGLQRYFVSDSTLAMAGNAGAIAAGGGTNTVPVYSDGTNWRIG
jgi:hypothetical protein